MARTFLLLAAISGFLTVALGAFGAHGLEGKIPESLFTAYQKAVDYQGLHTLALLAVGLWARQQPQRALAVAGAGFIAGIILFSGSLYAMALTGIRSLGWITPLGGLSFLFGWAALAVAAWRTSPGAPR